MWRSPTSTRPAARRRGTRSSRRAVGRGRGAGRHGRREPAARVVAELFDRHGDAFDVLVNVAGIDRPGYITDIDLADYRQVQAVNCEGPVFLTSEFMKRVQHLPGGADRGRGPRRLAVGHHVRQRRDRLQRLEGRVPSARPSASSGSCARRPRLPDGTERPFPCRVQSIIPAAMDTPMMEQWGIPAHLMMPPATVAGMVRTLLTLDPSSFVPEW